MGKSQVEAMESAQQEAAAEVNQPSTKPMSLWSYLFIFSLWWIVKIPHLLISIYYDETKKVTAVNEVLCKGCGTCVAACPSNAMKNHIPLSLRASYIIDGETKIKSLNI